MAHTHKSSIVTLVVWPLINVAIALGAVSMIRLTKYRSAYTAAILSVIPVCSPCFVLGIPFGIWAIVVLSRREVKRSFVCRTTYALGPSVALPAPQPQSSSLLLWIGLAGGTGFAIAAIVLVMMVMRMAGPAKNSGEAGKIAGRPADQTRDVSQAPTATAQFDGFQFHIPAGWSRIAPDRDKTAAMILLNGTAWHNADAMLKVDVGKPSLTAQAIAESFTSGGGQILPDAILVDGEQGILVRGASQDMSRPRNVVVIFKADEAYLIMAAGKDSVQVDAAFDTVLRTWRWRF